MVHSVALTGNIASGKSTVADFFSRLGIQVLNADTISRELSAKKGLAYPDILRHFGKKILLNDGEINRRLLRDLIFSNPTERLWLEKLLHPLIRQQLEKQIKQCLTPYCIVEIPLLIDKVLYPYLDKILVITAPVEFQIQRVMDRDRCSKEQALAILAAQPEVKLHLANADDVICNDSGISQLQIQVNRLHEKYLSLFRKGP